MNGSANSAKPSVAKKLSWKLTSHSTSGLSIDRISTANASDAGRYASRRSARPTITSPLMARRGRPPGSRRRTPCRCPEWRY
ncbi:MAG: hypothetical protein U0703_22400 [Anaerolineae bacterium]